MCTSLEEFSSKFIAKVHSGICFFAAPTCERPLAERLRHTSHTNVLRYPLSNNNNENLIWNVK